MSDRLPACVPLPDVPTYAEDVVFGNLGLPSGFDTERLQVNLRGIQRIRTVAGLGAVSIVDERGETGAYDVNVTSMDAFASAKVNPFL